MRNPLKNLPRRSPAGWAAEVVTLVSLAVTARLSAQPLAEWFGDGPWAMAAAVGAILVLDVLWLTGLHRLPDAIAGRDWILTGSAGAVVLAGAGGSMLAVTHLGGHGAIAYLPVAALALRALDTVFELRTPDAATLRRNRAEHLEVRNAVSELRTDAVVAERLAVAQAEAAVSAELLEMTASASREASLALGQAELHRAVLKARARAEKRMAKSDGKHAEAATELVSRPVLAPLADRLALPVAGPFSPVPRTGLRRPLGTGTAPRLITDAREGDQTMPAGQIEHGTGHRFVSGTGDTELRRLAREVFADMDRPKNQTAFRKAMREAGAEAGDRRLNALYKELQDAAAADHIDHLGQDVTAEEIAEQ